MVLLFRAFNLLILCYAVIAFLKQRDNSVNCNVKMNATELKLKQICRRAALLRSNDTFANICSLNLTLYCSHFKTSPSDGWHRHHLVIFSGKFLRNASAVVRLWGNNAWRLARAPGLPGRGVDSEVSRVKWMCLQHAMHYATLQ